MVMIKLFGRVAGNRRSPVNTLRGNHMKMVGGKWVGCCDKARYERMADIRFPHKRWSAVVAAIEILKCMKKNQKIPEDMHYKSIF